MRKDGHASRHTVKLVISYSTTSPNNPPQISDFHRRQFTTTMMGFSVGVGMSRAVATRQVAAKKFAAFDRYRAIRNFFRQEHIAALRGNVLPFRGLTVYPAVSKQRMHSSLLARESGTFSLLPRSNFVRAFTMHNTTPEKSPRSEGKGTVPPRDSKVNPPEENSIDAENNFPHARDHENYSHFFRKLAESVPHAHRPTRDDLLKVATNFWQRFRIRFKWFTVRSFRKFNADDISAFVSWFLVSQTLWILIGTTTFFSVLFATLNSLRLQNFVAHTISDYLTAETGITIIFESAIVPKWKDSRLSFKNVYVSRRPNEKIAKRTVKAAGHIAVTGYDVGNHPAYHVGDEDDEPEVHSFEDEDTNYTMFDLNIDSVDVTLSLARWLDGKGLVEDAVVRGVRGVVDRRNVFWDADNPPDPAEFRHTSQPGDFELKNLQLEDVLVTVHQPGDFRPYTASIFRADLRTFRKRWLFYDFLCAENVVGQIDNCLFSLHRPQSIGKTNEKDLTDGEWFRMSRFRIDGVNIDHLQKSTTNEGPISWITSGKVDAVLDIKFPRDPKDELPFNTILEGIADAISTSISETARIPGQRELAKPPLIAPEFTEVESQSSGDYKPKIVIDIDLRFRDLKAAVPIFTTDLSYVNNALIRPIVAFMNANRTLIPIHCRVVKDLSDFDGAWTMWETGLMNEIAFKTYDAMAYHVSQSTINHQRMKTISLWSLQRTAGAVMNVLKTMTDPMSAHLKDVYSNGQNQFELLEMIPLVPEL